MKSRFLAAALLPLLVHFPGPSPAAPPEGRTGGLRPITIDFFFQPGCDQCARVKEEILPELQYRYEGMYVLNSLDITVGENYLKLAAYQEKLGADKSAPVSMVLDGRFPLNGIEAIRAGLFARLDQLVTERLAGEPPTPPAVTTTPDDGKEILYRRVRGFTLVGVVAAGLLDGINPCAISTLVFFLSLLAVLKVSGRRLALVGITFVLASFVTYTAIGLGLLRTLRLFSGIAYLRAAVNWAMVAVLAVFAFLSFRDAWRYRRSGNPHDVTLQLPESVKMRIHKIMRSGLGAGSLFGGSLFIGAAVTVLESVCTGQVYLPTLAMVVKSGQADLPSYLYLLLYNIMFQVPIVTVFILTFQGLRTAKLLDWSRRNLVTAKLFLGLLFIALASLIIWL